MADLSAFAQGLPQANALMRWRFAAQTPHSQGHERLSDLTPAALAARPLWSDRKVGNQSTMHAALAACAAFMAPTMPPPKSRAGLGQALRTIGRDGRTGRMNATFIGLGEKMAIPDYETLMLPLMKHLADGQAHVLKDVMAKLADEFKLTPEERATLLPSGGTLTLASRVGWAKTYLKKAELLHQPKRGMVQLTRAGQEALAKQPQRIDNAWLEQFPVFVAWRDASRDKDSTEPERRSAVVTASTLTPDEIIDSAYQSLWLALADELLERVKACPPEFFERLVVQLLLKMGYGGSRQEAGKAVGKSGDGGIDGIINEDRLGLDAIYLQAKRWDGVVGRPEIQKFVGALAGQRASKGVFITTSRYSEDARDYAAVSQYKIVLIDGQRLAELMIEHDLGVSVAATYQLKRIDSDFFSDE